MKNYKITREIHKLFIPINIQFSSMRENTLVFSNERGN